MLKQGCPLKGIKPFGPFVFPREILVEPNVFHSSVDEWTDRWAGFPMLRNKELSPATSTGAFSTQWRRPHHPWSGIGCSALAGVEIEAGARLFPRRLTVEDAPGETDVEVLPRALEAYNESQWPQHPPRRSLGIFFPRRRTDCRRAGG